MTTQMIDVEQYFPLVLFIMLCKMVLTFGSVDELPMRGYSYECY